MYRGLGRVFWYDFVNVRHMVKSKYSQKDCMRFCQFIEQIAPLGKESIAKRFETGFRARGRRARMTGAGNQEHAEG